MSDYIGNRPAAVPLTEDQISGAADTRYWRQNGPMGSPAFRNKLINGDFGIWQRGTSFAATVLTYTADRWMVDHAGTSLTCSYTRQSSASLESGSYLRIARTAASGMTAHTVRQKIENVRTLAGKKATLSILGTDLTTTTQIGVILRQNFGSGGSASVDTPTQYMTFDSSAWARNSLTFDLASVSSKTIGSNHSLDVILLLPTGQNFQLDLFEIQLEEGSVATPFERRPIWMEWALCCRYFELVNASVRAGAYTAGANVGALVPYTARKRANPSVTLKTPVTSTNVGSTALDWAGDGTTGFMLVATGSAAGTVTYYNTATADAEL